MVVEVVEVVVEVVVEGEEANTFCLMLPVEQDSVIKLVVEPSFVESNKVTERQVGLMENKANKSVILVADDNPDSYIS